MCYNNSARLWRICTFTKKLDTLSQIKTKRITCNIAVERKGITNKNKITRAV